MLHSIIYICTTLFMSLCALILALIWVAIILAVILEVRDQIRGDKKKADPTPEEKAAAISKEIKKGGRYDYR